MNRREKMFAWVICMAIVAATIIFFGGQLLISGDSNQRAAKSRTALIARLEKLTLPDMTRTADPADEGCNGLDFNDCAAVFYATSDDPATLGGKLESSLQAQGFTVYKHDGPNRLDAFNNDSAMYLQFFLSGNNKVQVIVGEASNGQYAPS